MSRRHLLAAAATLVALPALTALPALAAEGVISVQGNDTITGRIAECFDTHAFEIELARGDVLRLRIQPTSIGSITARIVAPHGFEVNHAARLRTRGNTVLIGPFRVRQSGVYHVGFSTGGEHGVEYEAQTRVRHRGRKVLRLSNRKPGRSFVLPAGTTLQVQARRGLPVIAMTQPGEFSAETIGSDDPRMAALLTGGLAIPRAGLYHFERRVLDADVDATKVRMVLTPPESPEPREIRFPDLPDDRPHSVSWYGDAWVVPPVERTEATRDGTQAAPPAYEPPATEAGASPWMRSLTGFPAIGPVATHDAAAQPGVWAGPAACVGLPLAGVPSLAEVLAEGALDETASMPVYVFTREVPGADPVTFRVRFEVDGVAVPAPLSMNGLMTMIWSTRSVAGAATDHRGSWSLSLDPVRELQVLDGSDSWVDARHRTVATRADGFTLPTNGNWPSGALAWGTADPRNPNVARSERYDGTNAVNTSVGVDGQAGEAFAVDMRSGLTIR